MQPSTIPYRTLIRIPNVLALLSATCLARVAHRMFAISIIFHALGTFGSPALAGWISFACVAPGLLVSPLAGAFLDRFGAARGILVDLGLSAALVLGLAAATGTDHASAAGLLLLTVVYSLTNPLSAAGIRTLLPRLVPANVLDRANALDTALHGIGSVAAPSLAGLLVGMAGTTWALLTVAVSYAAAATCVALLGDTPPPPRSKRGFLHEALEGLVEVLRQKLLRGLAIGYALNLMTWGILVVAVPVAIARNFPPGTWETVSGLVWAGAGLAGGIGALAAGQWGIAGRELRVMCCCMSVTAVAAWPMAGAFGLGGLAAGLILASLLAGPIDVGVLTLRQRRTDPARLGRVLAVSMSLNLSGFPLGGALGGMLVAWSLNAAFLAAALASVLAAVVTALVLARDEEPGER